MNKVVTNCFQIDRVWNLKPDKWLMIFPSFKYKMRIMQFLCCKLYRNSRLGFVIWMIYFLGFCWSFPRNDPPIVNLQSCKFLGCRTTIWRTIMLPTMLEMMEIKAFLFHVANWVTFWYWCSTRIGKEDSSWRNLEL